MKPSCTSTAALASNCPHQVHGEIHTSLWTAAHVQRCFASYITEQACASSVLTSMSQLVLLRLERTPDPDEARACVLQPALQQLLYASNEK